MDDKENNDEDKQKIVYTEWGRIPAESVKSSGYTCPRCNWFWDMSINTLREHIIGFKSERINERPQIAGTIYVECPKCFTIFHFHVDKNFMYLLRLTEPQIKK